MEKRRTLEKKDQEGARLQISEEGSQARLG